MYQCILADFLCKAYSKVDFGHVKILDAIFLGQFLQLSTTVLNDNFKKLQLKLVILFCHHDIC